MNLTSKLFTLLFLLLFSISCAGTKSTTDNNTSETAESEVSSDTEMTVKEVSATETWHLTPSDATPYYGTGVQKAYDDLLAGKSAKQKVIVAIIDSGTDIAHEDLSANIWKNTDEIRGNNADDDGNGYVDDIYGWNFIGGPDSTHVDKDTYEVTRLYAKLSEKYEGLSKDSVAAENQDEFEYYQEIKAAFERRKAQNERNLSQVNQSRQAIIFARQTLEISNIDSVNTEDLTIKESDTQQVQQAKQIMNYLLMNGASESDISDLEEYYEYLQGLSNYGLNPEFNPRDIVGDDYDDLSNRYYGNNDVTGPSSDHGTHVAGIVGAVRDNGIGAKGIADIELMILRTVPDGDERDKDVANAIRYAAENGARVINMSFGKGYSPQKHYVDDAMRYADSLGVLMVSGSGNGSDNIDSTDSYPTRFYLDGGYANNYLSVGATSWQSDSMLVAGFSNYGKENVDLFAPGVDVYSTYPDNEYKMESGTSMASPVVAGVAALIMSYYPELSTTEVKDIILQTVTKVDQVVYKPGTQEPIPFSELSITGGIINAYDALKMAGERVKQ